MPVCIDVHQRPILQVFYDPPVHNDAAWGENTILFDDMRMPPRLLNACRSAAPTKR